MSEATPILVWTMGKVGTSTVSRALKRAHIPTLHMHSIRPNVHATVKWGRWLAALRKYRDSSELLGCLRRGGFQAAPSRSRPREVGLLPLLRREWNGATKAIRPPRVPHVEASKKAVEIIASDARPVRIITMVREPIARNISAFFENLHVFALSHEAPTDQLVKAFKARYPHRLPLEWFDREFNDGVDFDIFAEDFDREVRVGRYRKDAFEFLVMRMDAELERQQAEVSDFVGQPISLAVENSSKMKPYAAAYRAFKEQVALEPEYIEQMYGSKFARHFWTEDELLRMAQQHLAE
ncbi:putative capsular polysaccharide synthesis family protein [Methyloceanibacter caenitepidi]|nr:putative capsular polysaccharide synthesis family protein [Methyloceanibacter caenitepidi]